MRHPQQSSRQQLRAPSKHFFARALRSEPAAVSTGKPALTSAHVLRGVLLERTSWLGSVRVHNNSTNQGPRMSC
jgi:hypothetical protein